MDEIKLAQADIEAAHRRLERAVAAARDNGSTWAEIGEALGMSRQAAFKRFGTPTNPMTGERMTPRDIGTIDRLTEEFLRLVADGNEDRVTGMIHPRVRDDLPWQAIIDTWTSVLQEYGELESFDNTFVTSPKSLHPEPEFVAKMYGKAMGIVVGVTTIKLEAGEIMGRVAFDNDNAVVGVLYLPTDTTSVPF